MYFQLAGAENQRDLVTSISQNQDLQVLARQNRPFLPPLYGPIRGSKSVVGHFYIQIWSIWKVSGIWMQTIKKLFLDPKKLFLDELGPNKAPGGPYKALMGN